MAKPSYRPVKYAIIDAFADSAFKGNPAAVCLLEEARDETWLQSVASEFNISETCYLTKILTPDSSSIPRFHLRWFTPVAEVELCGHATLAASHFCFTSGLVDGDKIEFSTLSGILKVKKVPASEYSSTANSHVNEVEQQFFIELDFPTGPITDYNSTDFSLVSEALGDASIVDLKKTINEDILVILPSAASVADLQPQYEKIRKFPGRGVIVSSLASPESEYDFVSRFFCPKHGINEDPVCGSAHCALAKYWSKKIGKTDFLAYAASPRGGVVKLQLEEQNNRVRLQGKAVTVMEVFFISVAAFSVGSSYYHLQPNDARLVWDRLPMTIAFVSIAAIFIIERIDERKGALSILPFLVAGAVSILYWSILLVSKGRKRQLTS